jgi:hypothetical protein
MKPMTEEVLQLLKARDRGITALDALREVGCMRLAARIWEIKQEGIPITRKIEATPNGRLIARYTLVVP